MRLGGPQKRSGHGREEINSSFVPELEPLFVQTVAHRYTTELSRLLSLSFIYKLLQLTEIFLCFSCFSSKSTLHISQVRFVTTFIIFKTRVT